MCRYEDFDKVYREYKSIQEDLEIGNIGWEDDQYFREWEKLHLIKSKEDFKTDMLKQEPICIKIEKTQMIFPKKNIKADNYRMNKMKYKCKDCGKQLLTGRSFYKHLFEVHEQKLCEQCGEVSHEFDQKINLV